MKNFIIAVFLLITGPCLGQDLVIKGAVIYGSPESKPIINALIIIKDGKITYVGKQGEIAIPQNTEIIDGIMYHPF